jgi:serine/threonine protein kinase
MIPSYKDFYTPLFGRQGTTASDLYSLGMTIVYLLTGLHPNDFSIDIDK